MADQFTAKAKISTAMQSEGNAKHYKAKARHRYALQCKGKAMKDTAKAWQS